MNFLHQYVILQKSISLHYLGLIMCLTFWKVKQVEINHFPWFYFDFSEWLKEEIRGREWWDESL